MIIISYPCKFGKNQEVSINVRFHFVCVVTEKVWEYESMDESDETDATKPDVASKDTAGVSLRHHYPPGGALVDF